MLGPGSPLARAVIAATLAVAMTACAGDSPEQGTGSGNAPTSQTSGTSRSSTAPTSRSSTPPTAPSSTPPTAPSSTAPTAPSTSAGPTRSFPGPREAIEHLIAAWRNDDRAAALQGAQARAVRELFSQPAEGFSLYGCDTGEFATSNCNYRNPATGGFATITAEERPRGWIVTRVSTTVN